MFIAAHEFTQVRQAGAGTRPPLVPELNPEFAWRALEEVDYGLILVTVDGTLEHANHLARHEIARARFLRNVNGRIAGISGVLGGLIFVAFGVEGDDYTINKTSTVIRAVQKGVDTRKEPSMRIVRNSVRQEITKPGTKIYWGTELYTLEN